MRATAFSRLMVAPYLPESVNVAASFHDMWHARTTHMNDSAHTPKDRKTPLLIAVHTHCVAPCVDEAWAFAKRLMLQRTWGRIKNLELERTTLGKRRRVDTHPSRRLRICASPRQRAAARRRLRT